MTVKAVKPGDIFAYSWGYEQTNVDFYKVLSRSPKSVIIAKIPSRIETSPGIGSMSGKSYPVLDAEPIGKPKRKIIKEGYDGGPILNMAYGIATPYEGGGKSCSWYG